MIFLLFMNQYNRGWAVILSINEFEREKRLNRIPEQLRNINRVSRFQEQRHLLPRLEKGQEEYPV